MAPAEIEQTAAEIEVKGGDGKAYGMRATGSVLLFDGFLKVYEEGRDDESARSTRARTMPPKTTSRTAACRRSPSAITKR